MEKITVRRANEEDIPQILEYIDNKWLKNHWIVREDSAFKWQYTSDGLDFVIGVNEAGDIKGIMGYISYDETPNRDVALSMWMADPEDGFLGIQLLSFIMKDVPHRVMFSPGINVRTTESIYKIFRIKTGKMNQWYRLNDCDEYKIALVNKKSIPDYKCNADVKFVSYKTFDDMLEDFDYDAHVDKNDVPYKGKNYVKRHYYEHPTFSYELYGVKPNGSETEAVLVTRKQEVDDDNVLVFVDLIGNIENISYITPHLDKLMKEYGSECVYTYEAGVPERFFRDAGWLRADEGENIIPNYYFPFLRKNVEVNYCTTDENIVLLKGDGDQDRPK